MVTRWRLAALWLSAALLACGSDDDGGGGSAGSGGSGGSSNGGSGGAVGGSSGVAGSSGSSGSGGGGTSGSGGSAGSAGTPGACGAISTFADGKQPTQELHVSPQGSDSADGSAANPLQTIARAAQLATPGTAIRIHAGTYPGGTYIDGLAGTDAAPIWLGGAPGEARPVITGGGEALHFTQVKYLVVHDLEAHGLTDNGINIDDGGQYANADATRWIVFSNIDVHDIGGSGNQDCLKMSGVNDYWVIDSHFARCGGAMSGSGIDHVGCHQGLIAKNVFEEMSGNAVQCKGGSEDIEIRWNRMQNAGERAINMGGSTGFTFFRPPLSTSAPNFEAKNIRVFANLIVGGTAALAFVGCVECVAAHNTIVDPTNWIFRILQETTSGSGYSFLPAQNGRFSNNLVYFSRAELSTYVNIGAGTQPESFTLENNLWYAHDDPAQSQPSGLPAPETGGIVGQDPLFASPSSGDYHIPTTSPAAGQGVSIGGVSGDFDGQCYATPPSIGAFEAK